MTAYGCKKAAPQQCGAVFLYVKGERELVIGDW